jgi:hypothetical protein
MTQIGTPPGPHSDNFGDMMASSFEFRVGCLFAVVGVMVACGGSSKSSGDDDSSGKGGSGGTSGTKSTGGSSGTDTTGGTGNATSSGGTGATGGTTSTSGSGGSGDPVTIVSGTCPAFTACGGDVVGSWELGSICESTGATTVDGAPAGLPACATDGAVETASSDVVFEFKADGTFNAAGTTTFAFDLSFDDDCAQSTFMLDPASACTLLMLSGSESATPGDVSCALDGAVCDCHFRATQPTDEVGTYTIDGSQLTVNYTQTAADGTATSHTDTNPFCVNGDTFTEASTDGSIATLTRK